MEEEGKFRVEKFNNQRYHLWKMQMEDYLYQKDLHLSLGGKAKQPVAMKDEEWEVLNRKALGTIRLCLASSVAFNISKRKNHRGCDECIGENLRKTLGFQQGIFNEASI